MSAALALALDEFDRGAVTLQRQLPHQPACDLPDAFHNFTPSLVPQHWTGDEEMYLAPRQKICARDDHLKRISEALRRRLYPFTPLHQKVLGAAIGVSRNTVNNWVNGKCDPGSHEMGMLHQFFKSTEGCELFWSEIYGDLATPRAKKYAEGR